MTVILHPEVAGAFQPLQLTGDAPEEGVDAAQDLAENLVQIDERIDGDDIAVRDRGNNRRTISFSVTREFETPGQAGIFWLDHEAAVPRVAAVQFVLTEPGGAPVGERWMRQAAVQARRGDWHGCAVTHTYTLVGTRIYKTRT